MSKWVFSASQPAISVDEYDSSSRQPRTTTNPSEQGNNAERDSWANSLNSTSIPEHDVEEAFAYNETGDRSVQLRHAKSMEEDDSG